MTPEESQRVIAHYQQWLADMQLQTATLAAQLATANGVIGELNTTIEDLKDAPGTGPAPKPGPPEGDAHA